MLYIFLVVVVALLTVDVAFAVVLNAQQPSSEALLTPLPVVHPFDLFGPCITSYRLEAVAASAPDQKSRSRDSSSQQSHHPFLSPTFRHCSSWSLHSTLDDDRVPASARKAPRSADAGLRLWPPSSTGLSSLPAVLFIFLNP